MHANKKADPGWNPESAGLHTKAHPKHTANPLSVSDVVNLFRAALQAAGMATDNPIHADGRLHRVHVEGDKRGTVHGWYVLHLGSIPAGVFGHWKSGIIGSWRPNIGRTLTWAEQASHRERIEAAKALRSTDLSRARQFCRKRASTLWRAAGEIDASHPYLTRKGIKPYRTRVHAGRIVIPIADTSNVLHGLQFIAADGSKRFLTGTAKAGCFHLIGGLSPAADSVLAIAEGFATAATIHAATGWPTAAAFDAGNLESVALALRSKYPIARIVICADNDHGTQGNPGLTKGLSAARAVNGNVIAPAFDPGDDGTDWNDYAVRFGYEATATALMNAASEVQP